VQYYGGLRKLYLYGHTKTTIDQPNK